jgi:mono/diheme cytochrome c family protein
MRKVMKEKERTDGRRILLLRLVCCLSCLFLAKETALALPWDQDLFRQQSYQANEMARAPMPGTVPLGHHPFMLTLEEAETGLKNPVPFTGDSLARGRRLYSANCIPCHGEKGDGAGPVGKAMGVPDILQDFYKNRADGRVYAVIMLGGANMPRYGYKFSEYERWDIVNYLRFLQGKELQKK